MQPPQPPTGTITRKDYLSGGPPVQFVELTPAEQEDVVRLICNSPLKRALKQCMTAEELAEVQRREKEDALTLDLLRYELLKTMTPEEVYARVRLSIIGMIKKKQSFACVDGKPSTVTRKDVLDFMKDAAKYDDDIAAAFELVGSPQSSVSRKQFEDFNASQAK
jgi:hypothetical protein